MIDLNKIHEMDPVCIISGGYAGRLAWFLYRYPYPDGTSECVVRLSDEPDYKKREIPVNINDVIPIKNMPRTGIFKENQIEDPNDTQLADFKKGDRVIIAKECEYYGCPGTVDEVESVAGGCLYMYLVEPDSQREGAIKIAIKCREQDLVPAGYAKARIKGFDVGRYIDRNLMYNIAIEEYTEAVKAHVQEIIDRRRAFGELGLTDFILAEVAKELVYETSSTYKKAVLGKIINIIQKDVDRKDDPDGMEFQSMLTSSLVRVAELYMNSHLDELHDIMKDKINDAATKVTADSISWIIRTKFDFNKLIAEHIQEQKERQEEIAKKSHNIDE